MCIKNEFSTGKTTQFQPEDCCKYVEGLEKSTFKPFNEVAAEESMFLPWEYKKFAAKSVSIWDFML